MEMNAEAFAPRAREDGCYRRELELYRNALESMDHALCMFDADRRLVLFNSRYAEVIELPLSELRRGMSSADLIRLGQAKGQLPTDKSVEQIEREMWEGLTCHPSERTPLQIGDKTYAVIAHSTDDGSVVATFEDITAREQAKQALLHSEARLRAILDSMPDCVKIFDESGSLTYINPQGLELLQASALEELATPGFMAVPTEYVDDCIEVHKRVLAGEMITWSYEIVGLKGRRRHVEAHAVPFRMPDGATAHLCISRDIEARMETENELRRHGERLQLVHEATGLAGFEAGSDGVAICTKQLNEQVGLPRDTKCITFEEWLAIIHPDDRERVKDEIIGSLDSDEIFQSEFRIRRADTGETRWISSRTRIERDSLGNPVRSIGAHLDITERKWAEHALKDSEERFRLAADAAGLGIWDYDPGSDKREWSDRLREIFGFEDMVEPSLALAASRLDPEHRAAFVEMMEKIRDDRETERFSANFKIERQSDLAKHWIALNGFKTHKPDGQTRIVCTVRDITDEKDAEQKILWNANHDVLTGLANRASFQAHLEKALQRHSQVGLFMLDLDHFKQINDALGHDAGDELLKLFAERLKGAVRRGDIVARLGGDEFAIILPGVGCEESSGGLSRAIHDRLREPFLYQGRVLDCRTSIGATAYPDDGNTPDDLLKNADLALYAAKTSGRATTVYFKPELREASQRQSAMVRLARKAIQEDRIVPYYQPKVDLKNGKIVGFEALLRWHDEERKLKLPASIEAAFDDHDVAADLSDCIINSAIEDMRSWLDQGVSFGHIAVNASAAEFRRDNFAERVLESLSRHEIPCHFFQLEVTETVFLGRGAEFVQRALSLLHSAGVRIALDDFGTGYASLRHLKQFPVDILKIDQSFVRDMEMDPGDEAIIRAVVNLGTSLGITVVAEGIERTTQVKRLLELGCAQGQGFLFSKAVAGDRVPNLAEFFETEPISLLHQAAP